MAPMPSAIDAAGAVVVLGLAAVALGCAPRAIETRHWSAPRKELRAFIEALPRCPVGRDVPSVKEAQARVWPPAACVAVRGRLFQEVQRSCPRLRAARSGDDPDRGCVRGWLLWEPSVPVPARLSSTEERQGVILTGGWRCDDREAESVGMRLANLPRLDNDDIPGTRGLPQPIVVVFGTVPGQRFRPGDSIEPSEPISLDHLEATHVPRRRRGRG
jgi:hypothetical protein